MEKSLKLLDNINIRNKILIVIIPIILLGIGCSVFISYEYKKSDALYNSFLDKDNAAAFRSMRAATSFMVGTAQSFKILSYDPNSPKADKIEKDYRSYIDLTFKRLAEIKNHARQYSDIVDEFASRLKHITEKTDRIIALQNAGQTEEARVILGEVDPDIVAWRTDLQEWNDRILATIKERADAMSTATTTTIITVLSAIGIMFAIGIVFAMFVSLHGITAPVMRLRERMTALAADDITSEIGGMQRKDEIGEMAKTVQVFRENAIQRIQLEQENELNRSLSEKERIANEERKAQEAADVKFAVDNLATGLAKLSEGDVSYRIEIPFVESLDIVRNDFNNSAEKLKEALLQISRNAHSIDIRTNEIKSAADDLARRTEQQAAAVEQTASALEEITTTVKDSSERAREAGQFVNRAKTGAEQSSTVVRKTVTAMEEIARSANEVSNIIGVIDEIAFQTNLLALNAGVEAARAGDAGKGFAVVAQEVRELAQRSAAAAKEIKDLINTSNSQVHEGVQLVGKTGEALENIIAEVQEISQHVTAIVEAAQEQSSGLHQISTAVNQIDQDIQKNAVMVEESTAASHSLAQDVTSMTELLRQFNLTEAQLPKRLASSAHMAATSSNRPARTPLQVIGARITSAFSGNGALDTNKNEWAEF